ncbi:hypothetical protein Glove_186g66 [Diversispora epigaea]|uniref:Uncharacterized protein n=1 Tax=Diversispora epigaea TaxID=1348612 RepID=A0A397IQB3_9GLOM|nr:hypothetical protein Glove_186g66 [Diversispora epigaea]
MSTPSIQQETELEEQNINNEVQNNNEKPGEPGNDEICSNNEEPENLFLQHGQAYSSLEAFKYITDQYAEMNGFKLRKEAWKVFCSWFQIGTLTRQDYLGLFVIIKTRRLLLNIHIVFGFDLELKFFKFKKTVIPLVKYNNVKGRRRNEKTDYVYKLTGAFYKQNRNQTVVCLWT